MLGAVGGNSYLYSNSTPSVKRELGSKESLSDLLIQEGESLLTPSPPRAPTPTHETVTFEYDSDGDINGRSANPSGVLSTEEDEKNAFGVIEYGLNNGEIRNTGRHDQHGWIIWQMVEHPEVYRTYALMTLASFGSRCSFPFAKLSTKAPTVSLNNSRWC